MFALVALIELATFLLVESQIGIWWALAIAFGTAVVGSYLVRRSGIAVWRRLREKAGQGMLPGRELSDGAAILVAGAFLISPGFITDILGFTLLIPGVRRLIYQQLTRRFTSRVQVVRSEVDVIDVDPID
jgi:UPF0716 protein FxsA